MVHIFVEHFDLLRHCFKGVSVHLLVKRPKMAQKLCRQRIDMYYKNVNHTLATNFAEHIRFLGRTVLEIYMFQTLQYSLRKGKLQPPYVNLQNADTRVTFFGHFIIIRWQKYVILKEVSLQNSVWVNFCRQNWVCRVSWY